MLFCCFSENLSHKKCSSVCFFYFVSPHLKQEATSKMVNGLTYTGGIRGDTISSEGPASSLHTMGASLNILLNQVLKKLLNFKCRALKLINIGMILVYLNFLIWYICFLLFRVSFYVTSLGLFLPFFMENFIFCQFFLVPT